MKFFCQDCGRPVPQKLIDGVWRPGRCPLHPKALRISQGLRAQKGYKFFADTRAAIDAAGTIGLAFRDPSPALQSDIAAIDERRAA